MSYDEMIKRLGKEKTDEALSLVIKHGKGKKFEMTPKLEEKLDILFNYN